MINVVFNGGEAGEIESGSLPLAPGTHPFMPYRSLFHLDLSNHVNKEGRAGDILLIDGHLQQTALCRALTADRITIG
jgi:hypothetical protein